MGIWKKNYAPEPVKKRIPVKTVAKPVTIVPEITPQAVEPKAPEKKVK